LDQKIDLIKPDRAILLS